MLSGQFALFKGLVHYRYTSKRDGGIREMASEYQLHISLVQLNFCFFCGTPLRSSKSTVRMICESALGDDSCFRL